MEGPVVQVVEYKVPGSSGLPANVMGVLVLFPDADVRI
jgi:hypothetical protein